MIFFLNGCNLNQVFKNIYALASILSTFKQIKRMKSFQKFTHHFNLKYKSTLLQISTVNKKTINKII